MLFPTLIGENCWLKTSAQNKISHKGFISGCARNCGPTPAPLPTPSPAPVIPTPPPLPTPIPAPGPEKHVESIGGGLCLEFDKPFLVDSSNSSHLAVVPYVGGTADGQTYFATAKDYVDYNPKAHVHANFGQRLYRSTDQGETWSTKGNARPCCPVGEPLCNKVNVTWSAPLMPCAGTKACGDLPGAEQKMFDLGLLQFPSRTTGLGPNMTSSFIGIHDAVGAQLGEPLQRQVRFTGLPRLTVGNCSRGTDGAPLRVDGSHPIWVNGRILLPVIAYLKDNETNDGNDSSLQSQLGAGSICYGHRSTLLLFATNATDGLTWEYVATIATPSEDPTAAEGPGESALIPVASSSDSPELVVIFRQDQALNNSASERERAAYRTTRSQDGGRTWSTPTATKTTAGVFMLEIYPSALWLDPAPAPNSANSTKALALLGGRPGLHLWTSIDGRAANWSHDSNIAAIHNILVTDPHQQYPKVFVQRCLNVFFRLHLMAQKKLQRQYESASKIR